MTRHERLRCLAALEARLKVKPAPRRFLRCANDGAWIGDGPPDGKLRPTDEVFELLYITPTGEYGGRPSTPEELAAARDRPNAVAPGYRHHDSDEREAHQP